VVSGFTRDTRYYGDRLVYEALLSKWSRDHARCRCGNNWITHHAEPAGFTVVRKGNGFVALVGPGLTEDVDEAAPTRTRCGEPSRENREPRDAVPRRDIQNSGYRSPALIRNANAMHPTEGDPSWGCELIGGL
jgi:hypothetical protein